MDGNALRTTCFLVGSGLAMILTSCGGEDGDVGLFTGSTGGGGLSSDAGTEGSASGTSADTGGDTGDSAEASTSGETGLPGPLLDVVNESASAEGGAGDGCDKVDFLFVIDNSGSMQDEQANLLGAFPLFIQTIEDTLVDAQDFHIMAVSTDNGQNTGLSSSCINGDCSCTPAPVCCQNACSNGSAVSCNGFPCDSLPITACDTEYGTGKMYDANGTYCMLADDRRYMLDTQNDIPGTFQCIANVGTYGSGEERPMQAMLAAVNDSNNGSGGCNDGFLRDDAILVVVFITDEEDDIEDMGSVGDPTSWYADLVAAKNGDPSAVVMMGLYGDSFLPGGICPPGGDPGNGQPGAEDALRLHEFTTMFDNGIPGSVCGSSTDYSTYFLDAVAVIDTTCEEFNPPD